MLCKSDKPSIIIIIITCTVCLSLLFAMVGGLLCKSAKPYILLPALVWHATIHT